MKLNNNIKKEQTIKSRKKSALFINSNPDIQLYWNADAEKIELTEEQFNNKVSELSEPSLGYRRSVGSKTMLRDWPKGSMRIDQSKFRINLFVRDFDGNLQWYYHNSAKKKCNDGKSNGGKARKILTKWLKENDYDSIYSIYGKAHISIKRCIPRGFYYINETCCNLLLEHMNCIDACSQYPSGFIGTMPNANTAIIRNGTVKPTEEYPFAFYASGHLAIYNELDTHDWLKSEFSNQLCPEHEDPNPYSKSIIHTYRCNPDDDQTILMQAAEINPLEQFFREKYIIKESYDHDSEDYDQAKLVLNSLIGCMHYKDYLYSRTTFKLAHLAAVAIARGNNKILKLAQKIGKKRIAMIVVDSIIYQGNEKFGNDVKSIGQFHQEVFDADYMQRQMSVYMFKKNGKTVKFKHGAFNADDEGNPISEPTEFFEMNGWQRIENKDKDEDNEEEQL